MGVTNDKLHVFISYSRDDLEFADQLAAGLRAAGIESALDHHGISGGEDWRNRLGSLIRNAETVLSPSSARSEICGWEVEEANRLGKRILPIVCRPLENSIVPPRLQNLSFVFFANPKLRGSGLEQVSSYWLTPSTPISTGYVNTRATCKGRRNGMLVGDQRTDCCPALISRLPKLGPLDGPRAHRSQPRSISTSSEPARTGRCSSKARNTSVWKRWLGLRKISLGEPLDYIIVNPMEHREEAEKFYRQLGELGCKVCNGLKLVGMHDGSNTC